MKTAALTPFLVLGVCAALSARQQGEPAFSIPVRPLGLEMSAPMAPLTVTGFDVLAPDGRLLVPPLRLREDGVYTLRVAVGPANQTGTMPLALTAELNSGGPLRHAETVFSTSAGMAPPLEVPLRLEAGQGAGASVLRLAVKRTGDAPEGVLSFWPVAVLPAFVEPVPAACTLDRGRIKDFFGDRAVLLDARFRLGRGASIELPVPPALADVTIYAVGVVTSAAWLPRQDRNRTGLALASVTLVGAEPEESFPLRLGRETLQVDHDAYAQGRSSVDTEVRVFSEWTTGEGEKQRIRRNYGTVCALHSARTVTGVRISHTGADAVVQVDGIVLLPK